MATGDPLSLTIRPDGFSGDLVIEGFTTGATYFPNLGANNAAVANAKLSLTIVSMGFDAAGNATTTTRSSVMTKAVRKNSPNDAVIDETGGGNLTVRVSFNEPIFAKDKAGGGNSGTDPVANFAAGLVVNSGGAGQSSNARSGLTVINNSTLAYPKVIGKWGWAGYERVTGDFLLEFVAVHAFGQNGRPVACVKLDAVDAHSNSAPQQVATSMIKSTRTGDAKKVWVYPGTMSVSTLTQGDVLTCRARCYPWVGDAGAVLDTDTSADGVAAPSESLSPLMLLLDKNNSLACYASVDGVGAGTPACQATEALARTTPYATWAAAINAIKTYNNSRNGDNSLNCCEILMQNGTYTGPGTTTGSNTKAWCITRADLANGATEAGVIFNTATNAACNAFVKFQDVTFTGSGAGMLRGNVSTSGLWLHSCTINHTSTSFAYQWRYAVATQNTITAISSTGFRPFSTNRFGLALCRGNDGSAVAGTFGACAYAIMGNKGIAGQFLETGNASGNDTSDGCLVAWNETLADTSLWASQWASSTTITKGIAVIGNVAERITDGTTPFVQIGADNTLTNVSNVLIAHNTFAGQRQNLDYQEVGNVTLTRDNWYDRFNLFRDFNTKTDTFANATRTVTDAVLNGTTTVTSATANFVAGDVGRGVAATGLTNGVGTIATRVDATTITLSSAAIASASGVKFGIGGYIADGARIGNWAWIHGCGCRGSRYELANFPREFAGIDVRVVGSGQLGYTSDKSVAGTGAGNGDYTPTISSVALNAVPAGLAMIPGDLNGNALSNTGSGAAGAIQLASSGGGASPFQYRNSWRGSSWPLELH